MAGSQFVAELLAALSPDGQRAAQDVFRRWGGAVVRLPTVDAAQRLARRRTVQTLLASGIAPAEIVRIVAERFGLSRAQAYRVVTNARQRAATVTPSSRR